MEIHYTEIDSCSINKFRFSYVARCTVHDTIPLFSLDIQYRMMIYRTVTSIFIHTRNLFNDLCRRNSSHSRAVTQLHKS